MLKRIVIVTLSLFVLNLSFGASAFAQAQDNRDAQRERDAQIFVNRLGVGEKSRVKVSFKDDKKSVKGYISEINDENFVVTDKKKNTTTLLYSSVKKVSRDRLGPLAVIGIAVGVLFGAVVICALAGACRD